MTENYSVLMSVYIKEKPEYLKEAITSILNQTVKTNDFVIVCDGHLTEGLNKVNADFVTTYSGLFNVYRLDPYIKDACNGIKYGFSGFCGSFFGFVDVYVGFHAV